LLQKLGDTIVFGACKEEYIMKIPMLSCGVFQLELEKILPEVQSELDCGGNPDGVSAEGGKKEGKEVGKEVGKTELLVKFLPPALDANEAKLEAALKEGIAEGGGGKTALLYGSRCHPDMASITRDSGSVFPVPMNCAAIMLSPEKKAELDSQGNFYYLTSSSFKRWKEIYQGERGWDAADARVNFGFFEKIFILDSGVAEFSDEEIFDFFDFAQVPVETMEISLDYFKSLVLDLCRRAV